MPAPNLQLLPQRWHRSPRRWGHSLHSLCSYFAMFPPQIPYIFIRWLTERNDLVYDPFCGRGTTLLEACRTGRTGFGSDANPLAVTLSNAKTNPPTRELLTTRLNNLKDSIYEVDTSNIHDDISMLFSTQTLNQLCWLKDNLTDTHVDNFIKATLLGIMHDKYTPGRPPRGLSISMPNTFSMSPNYVRNYIKKHALEAPINDVFETIERKLSRIDLPTEFNQINQGSAWLQDSRNTKPIPTLDGKVKLIFTSPPYLRVIKYGQYNWIRLWLLNESPQQVDQNLVSTQSLSKYLNFISESLEAFALRLHEDGYLCLMVGDVKKPGSNEHINLIEHIWTEVASQLGWYKVAVIVDRLPVKHKVSRIWKSTRGDATKTDRILILSKSPRSASDLPPLAPIRWEDSPTWWT